MSSFKRKPAALVGAPISAQECRQIHKAFEQKFPGQVSSVYLSRELILKSIEGLSNLSGIQFVYGLGDATVAASRRIILVPTRNRSNGESGIIRGISSDGYLCDNGERINFEKLLTLLGNHVINFKSVNKEFVLSRLPRSYFWGIKKILKLLAVENCAGLVFHFGFNAAMSTPCKQYQSFLEVVDANKESLNVFMEYGYVGPACPCEEPGEVECFTTVVTNSFSKDADSKLDIIRAFRDNWLLNQANGQVLYEMYYFLSPDLVTEILDRPDHDSILKDVYTNGLLKCLDLISQNKLEEVKVFFVNLIYSLANRFLQQDTKAEVSI